MLKIMDLTTVVALLALMAAVIPPPADCFSDIQPNHVLFDQSFSLKSVITTIGEDMRPKVVRLTELYSATQRRARLHYSMTGMNDVLNDFFHDTGSGASLIYVHKFAECEAADLKLLYSDLFPRSAKISDLFQVANEEVKGSEFVVGPARLLFLIAHHVDATKQKAEEQRYLIRNYQVAKLEITIPIGDDPKNLVYITLWYESGARNLDPTHNTVPIRIAIMLHETKEKIFIDYFQHQLRSTDISSSNAEFLDDKNSELAIDVFTFPLSMNCTRLLGGALGPPNLFDRFTFRATRFSFESESVFQGEEMKHFVAFDGMTRSLRIDAKRAPSSGSRDTTEVLDYSANRRYIMSDESARNGGKKPDSRLLNKPECIVTRIEPYYRGRDADWDLSGFLTGASQFTYMGRVRLGAIQTLVYEGFSENLPKWFTQPTLFKNPAGWFTHRLIGQSAKQATEKERMGNFSVLIYFADDEGLVPPSNLRLLQLEVYQLESLIRKNTKRRVLASKFTNFVWDLNDSPSGQGARELFSHRDRCTDASNRNNYAQVDILLEEDETVLGKQANQGQLDWLDNWTTRNDALLHSIIDLLGIQSFLVYDLETKFFDHPKKSIAASFRIAEGPTNLYVLKFLGNALISEAFKVGEENKYVAHSIGECMQMINDGDSSLLYFMESSKTCIVLSRSTSNKGTQEATSLGLFVMDENSEGELYVNELQQDLEMVNKWTMGRDSTKLENKAIVLQRPSPAQLREPTKPEEISMRIKKVKYESINYLDQYQNFFPFIRAVTLDGYALTGSSSYKSHPVDESSTVSLSQCKAACLADFQCRSFSYCVRLPEIECSFSKTSFQAPGIREQLISSNGSRHVNVKLENDQHVELVRDRKCELHNKIYLDLFEKAWTATRSLQGLKMYPVRSKEQCAEICFRQTMDSIAASSDVEKKLREVIDRGGADAKSINQAASDHQEAISDICASFFYLEASASQAGRSALAALLSSNQTEANYCALEVPRNEVATHENVKEKFQFSTFKLDFSHLYERKFGFVVADSQLDKSERDAFEQIKSKTATSEQMETINKAISEGKNLQLKFKVESAARCASSCFLQTSTLWPACRSFDLVVLDSEMDGTHQVCYLNTITLGPASVHSKTHDKMKNGTSRVGRHLWHYEPLFGLISDETELDFEISASDLVFKSRQKAMGQSLETSPPSIFSSFLGNLSLLVIMALALAGGLVLGVQVAHMLSLYVEGWGSADGEGNSQSTTLITSAI